MSLVGLQVTHWCGVGSVEGHQRSRLTDKVKFADDSTIGGVMGSEGGY